MKQSDIRHAIKEFEQEFGYLTPIDPKEIGYSWAIGRQGDNVVMARKYEYFTEKYYEKGFEFSLMTDENYEHWRLK